MLRSPASTRSVTALSGAQKRQWFLHQHADATAYARTVVIEFAGRIDEDRLKSALKALTAAHEELRASYFMEGRKPVKLVHPAAHVAPVLEVHPIDEGELAAQLARIGHVAPALARAPSFKSHLFVLGDRSVLAVRVHGLSLDRWSDVVFLNALAALYDGDEQQAAAIGDRLGRAAAESAAITAGATGDEALAYWRSRLHGVRAGAALPTDGVRTFAHAYDGERGVVDLAGDEAAELAAFAAAQGIPAFAVHLAAVAIVLQRWTGEGEQLIGNVVPGRGADQAQAIGCFENVIPVRVDVPDAPMPAIDFVRAVGRAHAQDRAHGACPFELIVQQIEATRRGAKNPLFDVASVLARDLQPVEPGPKGIAAGAFTLLDAPRTAQVDLCFVVTEPRGGWQVACDYDASLFRDTTIATLLDAYRAVLLQLVRADLDVRDIQVPAALAQHAAASTSADVPVQIAGDLTLDPMLDTLAFWSGLTNLRTRLHAPIYGQLFKELVSNTGALAVNTRGFNIVVVRYEQWCVASADGLDVARSLAAAGQFVTALSQLAARNPAPQLVVFGQPATASEARAGFAEFRRDVDRLVDEAMSSASSLHAIRPEEIAARYPVALVHEDRGAEFGDLPYSEDYYRALATVAFRRASSLLRKPVKVIVLDCDFTLWDGVCSEVGVDELVISDAAVRFQQAMREQRRKGVLLCLCSQNDEADVWRVFDEHPRMVLRRDDITLAKIDWNSKSSKIAAIAQALNLSLDSVVFMDDDPLQCAEVRARLPEVTTLQVSIPRVAQALDHLWVLDERPAVAAPAERTGYYRDEGRRSDAKTQAASYADYLAQLKLKFTFHGVTDPLHIDRVSELSYRTNQFNTSARQRSSAEIVAAMERGAMDGFVLHLQDDFGDYGLVGAALFETTGTALAITDFFLSCRALNRGAEHRMLQQLAQMAEAAGLHQLEIHFRRTAKNAPALAFLGALADESGLPEGGVLAVSTQRALALRFDPVAADGAPAEPGADAPRTPAQAGVQHVAKAHGHIAHSLQTIAQLSQALKDAKRGWSHRVRAGAFQPPRGEEELALAVIWADVLGMNAAELSMQDKFMDLGGHSLLGMRMLNRLQREMKVELSLREFVEGPTIRELAALVRNKSLAARADAAIDELTRSGRSFERGEI